MQQRGFTLIELIIVIVILGILAVAAAPRFIDLSSDARESAMQGIQGAVKSASQITHSALLLNPTGNVIAEGVDVQTDAAPLGDFNDPAGDVQAVNAYPHAEDICDLIGLTTADGTAGALGTEDTTDDISCNVNGAGDEVEIRDDAAVTPANCSVTYTEAAANGSPLIVLDISDC